MKNLILVTFILIGGSAFSQNTDEGSKHNQIKDIKLYKVEKRIVKAPSVKVLNLNSVRQQDATPKKLEKAPQKIYIREELIKK